MAKLYFYYSAMNAGKSTALLQSSYNYQERGMNTVVYTAEIDSRFSFGVVQSRIGLKSVAKTFNLYTDFFFQIKDFLKTKKIHCVLIDECHFLTRSHVFSLTKIVDDLDIPVLCYGLRTDFQSELFPGSLWLLAWADKLIELKTVCYCGCKANRVLRIDKNKKIIKKGNQIMIGDNNQYISLCRKHYMRQLKLDFFLR